MLSKMESPDYADGSGPTPILDFQTTPLPAIAAELAREHATPLAYLRAAHRRVQERIRGVYTVDELQSASQTWHKAMGSCSQRMACLEALARSNRIATRVRALYVDGRFWQRRFPWAHPFIPRRILLAWPQFRLDTAWCDIDELFGSVAELGTGSVAGFQNDDETMFEALAHVPVDFLGKAKSCGLACATHVDLSQFLLEDAGFYPDRDRLFAARGSFQHSLRGWVFERIFGGRKSV